MLKLLILLECDDCGQPLEQATVCCAQDPLHLEESIEAMMFEAQEKGWSLYKHHCRCLRCGVQQDAEAAVIQCEMLKEEREKPKAS